MPEYFGILNVGITTTISKYLITHNSQGHELDPDSRIKVLVIEQGDNRVVLDESMANAMKDVEPSLKTWDEVYR